MAEQRYQFQRQQSQAELKRRKSMKQLRRGNSGNTDAVEAQNFEINGDSKDILSSHKAGGQEKLKGVSLFQSRILGLIMKRIICTWRRWVLFLLIVSIILALILFYIHYQKKNPLK